MCGAHTTSTAVTGVASAGGAGAGNNADGTGCGRLARVSGRERPEPRCPGRHTDSYRNTLTPSQASQLALLPADQATAAALKERPAMIG